MKKATLLQDRRRGLQYSICYLLLLFVLSGTTDQADAGGRQVDRLMRQQQNLWTNRALYQLQQVWTCLNGDCSSMTAESGDTLDCSEASYSIPCVVQADCSTVTGLGRCCVDSDDGAQYVGDGATANPIAGSGDDLGSATYGDVVALWAGGSCTGYLMDDGTCDTPAGTGDMTKAVYDTDSNNVVDTATALAANPTDCSANQFANAIAANGNLTCAAISDAAVPDNITISLAATASALAANPTDCSAGQFANAIAANGNLTCDTPAGDDLGSAAYGDVVALWAGGSCSGFLKNDGTCDTPGGDDLGSAAASDVVALWAGGSCSGYLKNDATCDTPAGDDLGSAAYSDVVALWAGGSCSGYMKSDGTCDTPGGTGDMTKATYDTNTNDIVDNAEALEGTDLGTLTDGNLCTYDLTGTEIDCNTATSTFQPADADLTTWAGVTPSANGQSLVSAANYAAMRGLLDLEAGTDFYSTSAVDTLLAGQDACSEISGCVVSAITSTGVTYENLNGNGDVGTGADQVAVGNHTHSGVYQPADADLTTWAGVTPGTGVATALANTANASGGITTPDGTATLTNKTYSTAGTGNDFTAPLNGLLDGAITDPADADDLIYAKVQHALTLTDIHCLAEGGGTITITLQECSTAGASCGNIEGAITCDSDGAEDDGTLTDGSIAAGAWIKVLFGAPSGTVNNVAWTVYGTEVW